METALRGPGRAHGVAPRFWCLGQEGVGAPGDPSRQRRFDVRGPHQSVLGGALWPRSRPRRAVAEALRQHPHRFLQRPGHDRPGLAGQGDACTRSRDPGCRLCVDRRYQRGPGCLCGRCRDSGHRVPAEGKDLDRSTDPADRQRRDRFRPGYGLRRLHGDRQADRPEGRHLPGELDEQPAYRGPEDGGDRDHPAVRLGGSGLDRDSGREPRQRLRSGQGFRHDARAGTDQPQASHRLRPGGGGQPAVSGLPEGLQDVRADCRPAYLGLGDSDRESGVLRQGCRCSAALRRHRRAGHRRGDRRGLCSRGSKRGYSTVPTPVSPLRR